MFDILKVLTQHTAFLEKNLKSLDIDQKKSIGIAFIRFYFLLPNVSECLQQHLKIEITEKQLISDVANNNVQHFKDALQKYDDETDEYAEGFEELEAMEINILSGLENCIYCFESSKYAINNFLLIIDILDYCENFSDNPKYWNKLLKEEIQFQEKIVKQISGREILDDNLYSERYKEVDFDL